MAKLNLSKPMRIVFNVIMLCLGVLVGFNLRVESTVPWYYQIILMAIVIIGLLYVVIPRKVK